METCPVWSLIVGVLQVGTVVYPPRKACNSCVMLLRTLDSIIYLTNGRSMKSESLRSCSKSHSKVIDFKIVEEDEVERWGWSEFRVVWYPWRFSLIHYLTKLSKLQTKPSGRPYELRPNPLTINEKTWPHSYLKSTIIAVYEYSVCALGPIWAYAIWRSLYLGYPIIEETNIHRCKCFTIDVPICLLKQKKWSVFTEQRPALP